MLHPCRRMQKRAAGMGKSCVVCGKKVAPDRLLNHRIQSHVQTRTEGEAVTA